MISVVYGDCVNCVCFLDIRSFVICLDDIIIVLWDLRNFKSKVLSLEGYLNWVKSIEYYRFIGFLVILVFDDIVRIWDINRYFNEEGFCYKIVL